jgi:hypothetical protein
MIDVKQAVDAALGYVRQFGELFPSGGVRLEETELREESDGSPYWTITLSFIESPMTGARTSKIFLIDGDTGQVLSMKTRSPFSK